jgi:hypothetical protein
MLIRGLAVVVAFLAMPSFAPTAQSTSCPVTAADGSAPVAPWSSFYPQASWFGNGAIWSGLWQPTDSVVFRQNTNVRSETPELDRIPVLRVVSTDEQLRVTGRRLDGRPGQPNVASSFYKSVYVRFPSEGCWELTATAADSVYTFVVNAVAR